VAVTAAEAAEADIVVVAVPLHKYRTLDPALLAGKTVIEAMNYWVPVDGEIDDFENDDRTSSEIVQDYLAGSNIVKTLNHISYHDLEVDGQEPGYEGRRALALAGDHQGAKYLVSRFTNRIGYDAVDAGPLEAGRSFIPGTEIFNGSHTAEQLRSILSAVREPVRL
jgi:predicted dinucleotide-binding enzyme